MSLAPAAAAAREAYVKAASVMVLLAALLTGASGAGQMDWPGFIVWAIAMAGPVVVVPALFARNAAARVVRQEGLAMLAEIEAAHGPLVGRTGQLVTWRSGDGFPLPPGTRRLTFVDGDLKLPVRITSTTPTPGGTVRVTAAAPVREGDIPYMAKGIAVEVTSA